MKALIWTPAFKRAYKRLIRRRPDLKDKIENALKQLASDAYHPSLHTQFVKEAESLDEIILLETVGTHEDVY